MQLKPALAVALAVLALALATVGVASAAQLSLEPVARPSAQSTARCDDAVATTTTGATSTTVTVSGIAPACAHLPVRVRAYSTSPVAASSPVMVPSGGGSATVTVPFFSPTAAHQTYVTIGDWPVPSTWSFTPPAPTTGCWVMSASGANTGKPCSIDLTRSRAMDFGDGAPQGQRTANVYLRFVVAAPGAGEHIRFTVDMRSVPGLPAGWSTWNTPNRGFALGNLEAQPGARCADLPLLTARAPGWASGGGDIHLTYFEDRPAHATGCS